MLVLPPCTRPLRFSALALFLLALPTLAQAQAPKPAGTAPVPGAPAAASAFKDLQVLPKDTSKAALKAIMKDMSRALGQDCEHCHKEPDMAADTDKKKVAREMMELVKTINAKFPTTMRRVGCWTCHRGKAEPDKTPGNK